MSATYRRIGDEIFKSLKSNNEKALVKTTQIKDDENLRTYGIFLESGDAQIRVLSCLIIVRTLKQGKTWTKFENFHFSFSFQ